MPHSIATALAPETSTVPVPLDWHTVGPWVRPAVASALVGVTTRTIRAWIALGYIQARKPAGGAVLVSRDSLRVYIEGPAV